MATQKKKSLCFNNSGFTVSELLAVISIVSILAAIAVPNFNAQREVYRLNGAARQVLGDLMWARTKAVQENNQFVVSFPNNTTYTIVDDDDKSGGATGTEWTRPQNIQNNYTDVTLSKRVVAGVTDPDPVFSPRGTPGATTVINVTNPSGTRTVMVRITGYVKID